MVRIIYVFYLKYYIFKSKVFCYDKYNLVKICICRFCFVWLIDLMNEWKIEGISEWMNYILNELND